MPKNFSKLTELVTEENGGFGDQRSNIEYRIQRSRVNGDSLS